MLKTFLPSGKNRGQRSQTLLRPKGEATHKKNKKMGETFG